MIIDFKYIPTFAQNKTNIPMKRIVLLLIALLAVGCSKSEEKQEDFSKYKLNVPEWLVGKWVQKHKDGLVTNDFEFSKDNYLLTPEGVFKSLKCTFISEGEYSYFGHKVYYFIVYATITKKYFKYSFDVKEKKCSFELNGKVFNVCTEENKDDIDVRNTLEEVTKYGTTIEKISDDEYTYKRMR